MIFFEVEAVVRKQLPKISTFSPKSSKLQSLIEYLRAGVENVAGSDYRHRVYANKM